MLQGWVAQHAADTPVHMMPAFAQVFPGWLEPGCAQAASTGVVGTLAPGTDFSMVSGSQDPATFMQTPFMQEGAVANAAALPQEQGFQAFAPFEQPEVCGAAMHHDMSTAEVPPDWPPHVYIQACAAAPNGFVLVPAPSWEAQMDSGFQAAPSWEAQTDSGFQACEAAPLPATPDGFVPISSESWDAQVDSGFQACAAAPVPATPDGFVPASSQSWDTRVDSGFQACAATFQSAAPDGFVPVSAQSWEAVPSSPPEQECFAGAQGMGVPTELNSSLAMTWEQMEAAMAGFGFSGSEQSA